DGFAPGFTGYDVAARDVNTASPAQARAFLARLLPPERGRPASSDAEGDAPTLADPDRGPWKVPAIDPIEEGSNAWAFAPSRTESGHAILVRNPHLSWTAGYYEAHVT